MKMSNESRKSSVLIVALFVLFFLSVIAISLGNYLQTSLKLTSRYMIRFQSLTLARGVLSSMIDILEDDKEKSDFDHLGEEWHAKFINSNKLLVSEAKDTKGRIIGKYKVAIVDEDSKLNINKADKVMFSNFLKLHLSRGAETLAENIVAYRDSKKDLKQFYSIYELLKVKGMNRKLFFGEDTNENKELDPWEDDGPVREPDDNKNGVLDLGLKDFLTVHSQGKININTASSEVLKSIPEMTENHAKVLIDLRKNKPFTNLDDLKDLIVIPEKLIVQIVKLGTVSSDNFKIFITAWMDEPQISREILVIVDRSEDKSRIVYWRQN